MKSYLTVHCPIKIHFYDVDSMNVVWHGNYIRFFEQARSDMLDRLEYNYEQMRLAGYTLPIVDFQIKYIRPLYLHQNIIVEASLIEYEHRLKIKFKIFDEATGELLTKAESTQVAVREDNKHLEFEIPLALKQKILGLLQ
ncbi:MAG: thioesterase [Chlamydiales bacterium]|jgi:acyl-CoA thioester hydrolase|nr:thioesterase [Chlamydiales bacterium]